MRLVVPFLATPTHFRRSDLALKRPLVAAEMRQDLAQLSREQALFQG
jgi:hypothetical protein